MKYMLIMRDTAEAVDAGKQEDFEQIINAMGAFNESMINAGVLAGGDGLAPPSEGFVVDFTTETPSSPTAPTARRTSSSTASGSSRSGAGRRPPSGRAAHRSGPARSSRCAG